MTDKLLTNSSRAPALRAMVIIAFGGLSLLFMTPDLVWAAPWDDGADKLLGIANGRILTVAATLAVIVVGVLSFKGRIPWGYGIAVIAGIVIAFSAGFIVNYFR